MQSGLMCLAMVILWYISKDFVYKTPQELDFSGGNTEEKQPLVSYVGNGVEADDVYTKLT
jgi:hypothetical protein